VFQLCDHVLTQTLQITILHVSPIAPQMRHDSLRAGSFTDRCCRDDVRLGILRVRHGRVTRLPQRRDVIDVYPKP